MALTQVTLFSCIHHWKEDSDVQYTKGYKISDYNDGGFLEVSWDIYG